MPFAPDPTPAQKRHIQPLPSARHRALELGRTAAAAAALAAAVLACGSSEDSGADTCNQGDTRKCVGPGACDGGQSCNADGEWSDCLCGGGGAGGGGGSGAGGGGNAGQGGGGGSGASGGSGGTGGSSGGGTGGSSGAGATAGVGGGVGGAAGGSGMGGGGSGGSSTTCPGTAGPTMVDMGGWCIDSTEVTRAQYAAFLNAKNGDTSGQPEFCDSNTDYAPVQSGHQFCYWPFDPVSSPNLPVVCVDWCDAAAYCEWAGKRLCGAINGGLADLSRLDATDPTKSQWAYACSQGGTTQYPYGDTFDPDACKSSNLYDVGTNSTCTGQAPPFSQVFSMNGNAEEWIDAISLPPFGPGSNSFVMGGGPGPGLPCDDTTFKARDDVSRARGFRCCGP